MAEVVRFAPSPTGQLHIGNVRTALYNWYLALRNGGAFVLRYDDTDAERSEAQFADLIAEDLAWLGINPSRVERQSNRLERYDEAAQRLRGKGLLYPCYEAPEELERKRARQRARGLPPIYDRAALSLSAADRERLEAEGRRPHWRFKLPAGARQWDDGCRGPQSVNLAALSDPVLVRGNGTYLYTLPSVVDDIELDVTTVVRGEDHVTNTGVQIALFEALGADPPAFAHHNLLVRSDGEPLSKRDNPLSVARLRETGYEPEAVASLAVLVGTAHAVRPVAEPTELAALASLETVSRGPATFDPSELQRLNAALVHDLPYERVRSRLAAIGADDPALWDAVRGNLTVVDEAASWAEARRAAPTVAADQDYTDDERRLLEAAVDALPPEPWDATTFLTWTEAVRRATGMRGRALFMPLRKALTGREAGPEMATWIRLLGHDEVAERLAAARASAPLSS